MPAPSLPWRGPELQACRCQCRNLSTSSLSEAGEFTSRTDCGKMRVGSLGGTLASRRSCLAPCSNVVSKSGNVRCPVYCFATLTVEELKVGGREGGELAVWSSLSQWFSY